MEATYLLKNYQDISKAELGLVISTMKEMDLTQTEIDSIISSALTIPCNIYCLYNATADTFERGPNFLTNLLCISIKNGRGDFVKEFIIKTGASARISVREIITNALIYEDILFVKFLVDYFKHYNLNPTFNMCLWLSACAKSGKIDLLCYMVSEFKFSKYDLTDEDFNIFYTACKADQAKILKCLFRLFCLEQKDVIGIPLQCLIESCIFGKSLKCLELIAKHFSVQELVVENRSNLQGYFEDLLIDCATSIVPPGFMEGFFNTLGFQPEDVHFHYCKPLRAAIKYGYTDATIFLITQGGPVFELDNLTILIKDFKKAMQKENYTTVEIAVMIMKSYMYSKLWSLMCMRLLMLLQDIEPGSVNCKRRQTLRSKVNAMMEHHLIRSIEYSGEVSSEESGDEET